MGEGTRRGENAGRRSYPKTPQARWREGKPTPERRLGLPAKRAVSVARGQGVPTVYGNMDLMFANMVSSGLCVAIHQPQTHLCNL